MAAASVNCARPIIAVVASGGNHPALARLPASLSESVELVRVGETPAEIEAQANELGRCTGLLWIPTAGSPSAPSDTLVAVWPKLSQVTWVHSFAAGVDGLGGFIQASLLPAQDRVVLTNGRGAFSSSLAEYALAGMLYFNKQIPRCQQQREARTWHNFVMDTMHDKTVGLVGYGSIGQATGRAVKGAFGSRVLALRRQVNGENEGPADQVFGFDDRMEFFSQCDFVVCSLPSTPTTQKFIGAAELAAMKPTSVLISVGRGAAVDEAALAASLQSGGLKGAVLDVFATEPLPEASPLWGMENVLMTSHNADFTEDYFELGWKVWGENLECFEKGAPLATPVDLREGY